MKGRFEGVHEKVWKGSKWVYYLLENTGGWTVPKTCLSSVLSNWKTDDLFNRVTCSPKTQKISVIPSVLFWESSHFIILSPCKVFDSVFPQKGYAYSTTENIFREKGGNWNRSIFNQSVKDHFLRCSENTHEFWKRKENFFATLAFSCINITCVGTDKFVIRKIAKIMHGKVQH